MGGGGGTAADIGEMRHVPKMREFAAVCVKNSFSFYFLQTTIC